MPARQNSLSTAPFRLITILWVTLLICVQASRAQSVPTQVPTMAASNTPVPFTQGVAVLTDGRVFQGAISEVPGGYRVHSPGGSSILPFDQISLTATTLTGAYETLRNNIQFPSADAHLKLAEWCLANGLHAQAETEVHSALKLEPVRTDARALLKQIDAILRPSAAAAQVPRTTAPRAAISVASFTAPSERRILNLSRETQIEYMRKVQPLLINKCANAGCHSPEVDNKMALKIARLNSAGLKSASEHNLEVLSTLIDFESPLGSPLLTRSKETSDSHRNLFFGPRNAPQLALLEAWVQQVAREHDPDLELATLKERERANLPVRNTLIQPDQPIQFAQGMTPTGTTVSATHTSEGPPGLLPNSVSASQIPIANPPQEGYNGSPLRSNLEMLAEIRKSHRPDAFDPEEFNRMMHGTGSVTGNSQR